MSHQNSRGRWQGRGGKERRREGRREKEREGEGEIKREERD